MTLPPILSISIHLPLRPTLIHHRTVRTCLCLRLCLSIPPLIFHLSPSLLPSSIHPLLVLEAPSMMTGLSNTFSSPSLSLSIHPPRVPLHLCTFIIFSRSPAELASVSEPSPPQTWRPRSPAPRRGSDLLGVRKRQILIENRTADFVVQSCFLARHARTHAHTFCLNPRKASI